MAGTGSRIAGGAASGASMGATFGPWGALVGGAAGAGASWLFGRAGDRQRRREVDEAVRRFQAEADQTMGSARATGAALGVETDSRSLTTFLSAMDEELRRQADWMRETGATESRLSSQAGVLDLASGIGGALFQFGQAKNWWQKPPLENAAASGYSGLPDYLRRP
jgi:hypothetical protein